jgi:hypothetical protein
MKPIRVVVWGCALALLAAGPGSTRAAWDNVFQVCCSSCGQPAASFYAPPSDPCCTPPPQRVCTTRYVQRSYYQPVTCYQTRTYYEPVTTYRTSYYYEPVTTYRTSCYCDPCTGCCHQVACPQTCYQLRSQCCPVQSYVQRCCSVPVTTYQQSCYWEPVTTCCEVPSCPQSCPCPQPCPCPTAATGTVAPGTAAPPPGGVLEQRTPPPGGIGETRDNGTSNKPYDLYHQAPGASAAPPTGLNRQVPVQGPAAPQSPAAPPSVRLDKIVLAPGPGVEGQVVRDDRAPAAGAKVMFVNADRQGSQQSVTADGKGQFRVTLASGSWLVYVHGADGKPVFHSKIELRGEETRQVTLVSR